MNNWSRRAFITAGVVAGGATVFGVSLRRGNPVDKVAEILVNDKETLLNIWLKISADNSTTVIVPHAEMGQGVHTTLAMMLADELDADWSTVTMLEAPAHEEYANYAIKRAYGIGNIQFPDFLVDSVNGFYLNAAKKSGTQTTGDSNSVRVTGEIAMRVAGASAKAVLIQAASDKWHVSTESLRAQNSHIFHDDSNRRAPFAEFLDYATKLSQPPAPALKSPDQFTIMGNSVPRFDVRAKVDGSADYGIDVSLPGMKYAAIRAAPVFGSMVEETDTNEALAMPGVHRVVNLGNAVAIVADSYWQAQQAVNRVGVSWTRGANNEVDQGGIFRQFSEALDSAAVSETLQPDVEIGDTARAFSDADRTYEAEYRVPYLAHATMEPMNCTAWVHDEICELWLGTQNPLGFKQHVAKTIDYEQEKVALHNQYLGGGFGRRSNSDYAEQAARVALEVPYPVKLIWSREEDIQQDHFRQASISRFSAALNAQGQPTGWKNQYVGKYFPLDAPHIPYQIDNQLIEYTRSRVHVPWGFWRSVDHSLHTFFTESFIDELAFTAGSDPLYYRRELLQHKPRLLAILKRIEIESSWSATLPKNCGRGIALCECFGTNVAQVVDVEIRSGKPRVKRVVCVVDAGFAMHPDGLRAQMESGIIYGLSAALYGEISIRHGSVEQSNFHDYPVLRMSEAPAIETHIINGGGRPGGAGEVGTPVIAPALTNAIFFATGVRIRELPVSKMTRFE